MTSVFNVATKGTWALAAMIYSNVWAHFKCAVTLHDAFVFLTGKRDTKHKYRLSNGTLVARRLMDMIDIDVMDYVGQVKKKNK